MSTSAPEQPEAFVVKVGQRLGLQKGRHKMTGLIKILVGVVSFSLAASVVRAEQPADPNHLLVEAGRLILNAESSTSLEDKMRLLEKAQGKLMTIVDSYPSSELAVKLVTGQGIGTISLSAIREAIKEAASNCWTSTSFVCVSYLARENAKLIDDPDKRSRAFDSVIAAQVRAQTIARRFAEAAQFAESIDDAEKRASELASIAKAQAEAGEVEGARVTVHLAGEAAKSIENAEKRASELASIARAQAEAGEVEGARVTVHLAGEAAKSIENAEKRASELASIARAQAEAGEVEGARVTVHLAGEAAKSIENAEKRASELASIARAQAEAGDMEEARVTARLAGEAAKSIENTRYYTVFVSVAKAQAAVGNEEEARAVLDMALEAAKSKDDARRLPIDIAKVAQFQAEAGYVEEARAAFDMAAELAKSIDNDSDRSVAFSIVAGNQSDVGLFAEAVKTVKLMIKDAGTRRHAAYTVQKILSNVVESEPIYQNVYKEARRVLEGAVTFKAINRTHTLISIAKAQAKAGAMEKARSMARMAGVVAKLIVGADDRVGALVSVARVQAEAGDVEEARNTVRLAWEAAGAIKDAGKRFYALTRVAEAQAEAGDVEEARKTVRLAGKAAGAIDSAKDRARSLTSLTSTQVKVGDVKEAQKTARLAWQAAGAMIDDALLLDAVAKAQAEAGDVKEARKTVRLAGKAARSIDSAKDRARSLTSLTSTQVKVGDVKEARKTARLAGKAARSIDNATDRAFWLTLVARAQAEAGDAEETRRTAYLAWEAAGAIDQVITRTNALARLASVQAEAGLIGEAEVTLRAVNLNDITPKGTYYYWGGDVLADVALAQYKAGNIGAALETSILAFREVNKVEADIWITVLASLASAQVKMGNIEDVLLTADVVFQTAKSNAAAGILVMGPLDSVALIQAKEGLFAEAVETAKLIIDDRDRSEVLTSIASAQAEAGDREGAKTTAGDALEGISDWRSISIVMDASLPRLLVKLGNRDGARTYLDGINSHNRSIYGDKRDDGWYFVVTRIARMQVFSGLIKDARRTLRDLLLVTKSLAEDNRDPDEIQSFLQDTLDVVAMIP